MAKKQNITLQVPVKENIVDVEYSDVMQKSYIDYAMSVIIARAIPDIRDGLKPVQRRTIYDMDELGASSSKPYRKSARIVGDTMGKYHPHGDSSIYDALVVMAQEFKKGYKLVDGHGNFGSIEGDGAAAERYTEARLAKFAEQVFLEDLEEDTVDFVPNYDENEKEPEILPCRLPNFLINGSEGIAVGMTTSTPPHNITETIDAAVYFMDHPDCGCSELLQIIKGPDFPTGGIIANKQDLLSIYETGSGKLRIRGKIVFEQGKGSRKDRLVVTEIPYTMIGDGIGKFLQSVADLVENRTLPEIVDITNQTSSDGIRIVMELKKGADIGYVENILYKKTKLEDTFGVNMLAVHNKKPEIMNLCSVLKAFTEFQYEIYTRKYKNLMKKAERRIEILNGLIKAVDLIDLIIEILRGSRSIRQAKECLVSGKTQGIAFKIKSSEKKASTLDFTETQADSVLAMPLSRLVGLELDALQKELSEKMNLAAKYESLLSSREKMKEEIKKELFLLKKEFGVQRKTEVQEIKPVVLKEKEEDETDIVIVVDKFYYIHASDWNSYEKNPEAAADSRFVLKATNKSKIAVFCDSGKAHILKAGDIPYGKLKDKGQPLDNICNYDNKKECICGMAVIKHGDKYIFTSTNGYVKSVDITEFDAARKTIDATKLKDGGKLLSVFPYRKESQIVLGTKNGIYIRFRQDEISEQKKNAAGVLGIKLSDNDEVIYAFEAASESEMIKTDICEFEAGKVKLMKRGGKGTKTKAAQKKM